MIVRCTSCSSAFSVDDEKIENKRFAFTCPKCETENVIDNRIVAKTGVTKEAITTAGTPDATKTTEDTLYTNNAKTFPGEETVSFDDEIPDFDLDSIPLDDATSDAAGEESVTFDDEIPDLDMDSIPSDDATSNAAGEEIVTFDDEILDLDMDSIPSDDATSNAAGGEIVTFDDEIPDLDLDIKPVDFHATDKNANNLDLDLDISDIPEPELGDLIIEKTPGEEKKPGQSLQDEEFTISFDDIDDLTQKKTNDDLGDIPIYEENANIDISGIPLESVDIQPGDEIKTEEIYSKNHPGEEDDDESITIDLSSLDIELEEDDTEIKTGEMPDHEDSKLILTMDEFATDDLSTQLTNDGNQTKDIDDVESITIDLDSLDIELEDGATATTGLRPDDDMIIVDQDTPGGSGKDLNITGSGKEDDITLNLAELDIDLDDSNIILKGEQPDEFTIEFDDTVDADSTKMTSTTDEDITLDLDSLDISLEETSEFKTGELPDYDNEKITLDDAGLSIDELTGDEIVDTLQYEDDDEIRLTLDEIDPDLDIDSIHSEIKETDSILTELDDEKLLIDDTDDLIEIADDDFDDQGSPSGAGLVAAGIAAGAAAGAAVGIAASSSARNKNKKYEDLEDDLIDIDLDSSDNNSMEKHDGGRTAFQDMVPRGSLSFSIDFSLKYSRLGALARILGLFNIVMIPHMIVYLIYSILASILGFINQIIVLADDRTMEAFSEIQENTLRYALTMNASIFGIVEEYPIFAGRENLDYPLQMKITHPIRYSKFLAFMRLIGIGILIISMPHLIILSLMSITIPFIYIIDNIFAIITGRRIHFFFDFMTKFYKYMAKIAAFMVGLINSYPGFRFD